MASASAAQNPNSATSVASAVAAMEKPRRQVSIFKDRYNIVLPYCATFKFEANPDYDYTEDCDTDDEGDVDADKIAEPIETLIKYVTQIRESFGFDVDCIAPCWFNGAFIPIDLSKVKFDDEELHDDILKIADLAISEINAEMGSKNYEVVELEKVVVTCNWLTLLTLRVKEVDCEVDDMKTIQAIVYEDVDGRLDLEQWRFKPVEGDVWYS